MSIILEETIIVMTDAKNSLDLEIHSQKENKLKKIKTLFIYSMFEMIRNSVSESEHRATFCVVKIFFKIDSN